MQVLYSDKKIEVRAKFPCDYVGTDLWVTGTWSPYGWHVSSVLFNDDADVVKQTRITTYDGYSACSKRV